MKTKKLAALGACLALVGCGSEDDAGPQNRPAPKTTKGSIVLASVEIAPNGNRMTYVQTVESIEHKTYRNDDAIEIPGHNVLLSHPPHLFVGLMERPVWQRYTLQEGGGIKLDGEMSLAAVGANYLDYGNAIVDAETAVSVLGELAIAVVWNPSTMEIKGTIDLGHLRRDGYSLETYNLAVHEGRVYIPGRWADWIAEVIYPGVSITIVDPHEMKVVGVAEDDRCTSGGFVVFDPEGYGYVLGDGRNLCAQVFAAEANKDIENEEDKLPIVPTCLLRIPPGGTDFEEDFYFSIPELTGGLEAIGEIETAVQGSGVGFAKMFYDELLGREPDPNFGFWSEPVHKVWRIELGDEPVAVEVEGAPFAGLGFTGSRYEGRLYTGETPDGQVSEVYAIDPDTNTATHAFTIDGYFVGLHELDPAKAR